jgi:DNA-binding CsgD family transcriptional regulator/GAF domain-containing protein
MVTTVSARVAAHRAHDPGDAWNARGPLVPDSMLREVRQVLDAAGELLAWTPSAASVDYPTANAALSQVWSLVTQAVRGDRHAAERVCTADELWNLLDRVTEVQEVLRRSRTDQRERALRHVGAALARVDGARGVQQLTALGVEALCGLGFDRAIASDVRDSVWSTEAMCVRGDPQWAEEIVRVGRQNPRQLRGGLVEAEAARRRTPLVVTNVQHESHVHRQIAEASLARSYVIAPVLVDGRVVGLLHADCYFQRRNVDEFDRDLLAAFAVGYGYALHRTILLTRLAALRESMGRLAGELTATVDAALVAVDHRDHLDPTACLLDPDCTTTSPHTPARPGEGHLSRRELDVLRLMAAGDTNARIATRLVLSEGTVKSHVRNILRKLGAANRAEAVTRWLSGPRQRQR